MLFNFQISIAFFNFAGISVTKEMSATTRMVLDSVRTLVIWGVSLLLRWQDFYYLQLIGFAVLLTGMCIYNDIVIGKSISYFNLNGYFMGLTSDQNVIFTKVFPNRVSKQIFFSMVLYVFYCNEKTVIAWIKPLML